MPRKKEKVGAPPGWMTTMSDMNTLLMVFFIMLFSLLSWEPASLMKLGDSPIQAGYPEGKESIHVTEVTLGKARDMLQMFLDADAAREAVLQIEGSYVRVARRPEGVVLTLGGEFEPFEEASYRLKPSHYKIIELVFRWMKDRPNRIIVRGYTASIRPDSLVKHETEEHWRPWTPADGEDKADWHMLAYHRADEVTRVLMRPAGAEGRIGPERLTIQPEGPFGVRRAKMPSLLRKGVKLDYREGELIPDAFVRQALSEAVKDRRVDIVVVPEGS